MILQEVEEINWPQRCNLRLLIDPDALQSHNPCSYPETDLLGKSPVNCRRMMQHYTSKMNN